MNKSTIFKRGSTTYYYSSLFFPPDIRDDVFTLYAFVRTADDFVDEIPQQIVQFQDFKKQTRRAFKGDAVTNPLITDFVLLSKRVGITQEMVEAFFTAMEADTKKTSYPTYKDLQQYIYGSASVIGLMMACIMKLPPESHTAAKKQGEAMQLINFIRDIKEDLDLGRVYLPKADIDKFQVTQIPPKTEEGKRKFIHLVRFEINRYRKIQEEAQKGYHFIPPRYRIPVMTASSLYNWTAQKIEKDPLAVFQKKIKPSKFRVIVTFLKNYFFV